MFRKMILSVGVAASTVTGFAASKADAHPPEAYHHLPAVVYHQPVVVYRPPIVVSQPAIVCHERFEVLIRCGNGWENRGSYRDMCDAERAAHHLRHEGFPVQIREL